MLKVICVDNKREDPGGQDAPELRVGKRYRVLCKVKHPRCKRPFYILMRLPWIAFDSLYFAPCNGPDETDIAIEREVARLDRDYQEIMGVEKPYVEYEPVAHARLWKRIGEVFGLR